MNRKIENEGKKEEEPKIETEKITPEDLNSWRRWYSRKYVRNLAFENTVMKHPVGKRGS